MTRAAKPTILSGGWADFIKGPVSILAASRDVERVPSVVRVVGCRVAPDRRKVTVLVNAAAAEILLDHVRATGVIAVVFSRPSTHVSIQLKGSDARVTRPEPGDAELARRYIGAFVAEVGPLGFADDLLRAFLEFEKHSDLSAITFTPAAAFLQTPGPKAGIPLGS